MIRFIKHYVSPYWPFYLFGLLALIITNYIATLIPLIIKDIIDLLSVSGSSLDGLMPFLKKIVILALILAVSRTCSRVLIFYPGRSVEYDLRQALFSKLMFLSPRFYRSQKIGDLMSRMINDIQSLRATAALGFLHIINTTMIYIIVFAQMARIDLFLTLIVILPIPIMMMMTRLFVKHLYKSIRACQERLGDLSNYFVESLSNITIIKSYSAEDAILKQFESKNEDYFKQNLGLARVRSAMFPFIGIIGNVGQLFLLFLGGRYIIEGSLSIGEFVAMSAYIMLLSWPTASLAWIINIIQRGKSSWERIEKILSLESDFKGDLEIDNSKTKGLHLELKNLSFSFNESPVLTDISLTIKPGQSIGFFGATASGKSTLLQILAGLEQVDNFLVNDLDFNSIDIGSYRNKISYVSQLAFLFSVSIYENISFQTENKGSSDLRQLVEAASEKACVLGDIKLFPEAFNTIVGEKGVILSGGQKSRLALARAFYKQSDLMILDDVLSAVDHDTEKSMIKAMFDQKQAHQSLVLSSHRISALTHCDVIHCLENGRIAHSGTHDQLLEKSDFYRKTYEYQQMMEASS